MRRGAPERSVTGAGSIALPAVGVGVEDGSARAVIPAQRVRRRDRVAWQMAVALIAVAAGAVAVWVTLPADFLRYPAWLAAQKAVLVVGPALTGVYWMRRRPRSRFGPMLIAWGLLGALFILQSSSDDWLFTIGLLWEKLVGLGVYAVILAFPTGRLDRPSRLVLGVGVAAALVLYAALGLVLPQPGAGDSISGCRSLCPHNELAIASDPALAVSLMEFSHYVRLALALAVAALLVHRFITSAPPRKRALAVGAPVALLFALCHALHELLAIVGAADTGLYRSVSWVGAAAGAAVWCGFLFALIAAELFAARAMKRLVEQSTHHPSERELELMLREPLGDPQLRLHFLDTEPDAERQRIDAGPGRDVRVIHRDAIPAVAIVHDTQLDDDPELLTAAGAVALLAAENARLDARWNSGLQELRKSRARIVRAGDAERRKVEQNLHDGVQQRLIAIRIDLGLACDAVAGDSPTRGRLQGIGDDVEAALDELREVAHGLYPPTLADWGIVTALERIRVQSGASLTIEAADIGRYSPELETAVYYSCLESIQNASKHGGPTVAITVRLRRRGDVLTFRVTDNGPGFDPARVRHGAGLQSMRDRLGALEGRVSVVTAPGRGTTIAGTVPVPATTATPPEALTQYPL